MCVHVNKVILQGDSAVGGKLHNRRRPCAI